MKQFRSFVKKEYYHIFRDPRTMMILLLMPIIQIILFGFAITTEIKNAKIAVFDPSMDEVTMRIKEQLNTSPYFTISNELTDYTQINDVFKTGEISMVIVFSEDFSKNILHGGDAAIQLVTDGTEPNQANSLTNYATQIISGYQQELMAQGKVPFQIIPEIRMLYNPQMKGAYNFVPGVMGMILMLICAMMTSIAIVREKEMGTMEVLLASPIKPIYIILAKMVPYFTLSVVNLITILLLSVYVLGVPIAGSLFWLMFVSFLFILVALALGLLVSSIVDTQMAAMLASGMVLMMPVILLSGMMFPIESMPKILQYISAAMPPRWYIGAVKKIMIQGADVQFAMKEIGILTFMAFVLIVVSLKKFKTKLN